MALSRPRPWAFASVAALGLWLPAAPAAAHGGDAAFEVLEAAEVAPGTVSLQVAVTYANDGDPAEGALVDVVPSGPGAAPGVRLEREAAGTYAASLELDETGTWVLSLTSAFPPGQAEVSVEVGGAPKPEQGDEVEPSASIAPAAATQASTTEATTTTEAPLRLDEPEAGGAEGGTDTTNLVVAAASGIIGGGLGLWFSRRRSARKRAEAEEPPSGGAPVTGGP